MIYHISNLIKFNNEEEIYIPPFGEEEDTGPVLEIYGTDLTYLASKGELSECFGREKELLEMMEILVRRQKNNPVLVGSAGVGKTALVELFASKLVKNLVPFVLEGRIIISLDLPRIVAGSRYRGEFEGRFQKVIDEVFCRPNVIIFIDEIHNISGTGAAEGSLDAANILKPVLSRTGFQCIGATTTKEYERIAKDQALNRRFQPIKIEEASIDETIEILFGLRPSLEAFHNVEILPGALRLAANLADRYIYDRFLPDKAIDVVDRAAAKEVIRMTNVTHGSIIGSFINASINHIGALRTEAFRRGDIASEFIFYEIENAYRNFILRWVETPTSVPEKFDEFLSPISQSLFDQMRVSVLQRVDDLVFASSHLRTKKRKIKKINNLSSEKNLSIYFQIKSLFNQNQTVPLNLYRISIFLFTEWLERTETNFLFPIIILEHFTDLVSIFHKYGMFNYLTQIREKLILNSLGLYSRENDFFEEDIESYEETYEVLSELEEVRMEIFENFLSDLKPVLQQGIIDSLHCSSNIDVNDYELRLIYILLGYFSTNTGRVFLSNLNDPDLVKKARKLGDFSGLKKRISQAEIRTLLTLMTGIPMQALSNTESEKLLHLESTLHKKVIGQEEAISAIAKAIRRSRLGIQNPNRPIASFLFCGPTGVGKTEITKALAATLFNSESDMIRFDMSEFMEKFNVSRLVGSPPGYVGYEDGGQLTDAVRTKPYSVILFDEIEKAHPDILNVLLQILEDGRLTDNQKRLVLFDNTVIIMTSNAASEEIQQIIKNEYANTNNTLEEINKTSSIKYNDPYSGTIEFLESPIQDNFLADLKEQLRTEFEKSFRNFKGYKFENEEKINSEFALDSKDKLEKASSNNLKNVVLERLSHLFLPEFLNRLDDIIIFKPLQKDELRKICDIMINQVTERVKSKNLNLIVDDNVRIKLSQDGYNPLFGARPLRRLVTKNIEDLISEDILKNPNLKKEREIRIVLNENNKIIIKPNIKT
jgi:ATP-dependent Clp protease ATP-binding subunit ClpA